MEVVLNLSPHRGGTSETLAQRLVQERGGRLVQLRDFAVRPCTGCGVCQEGECPLAGDDAETLFGEICQASSLLLVAPVYFYHLPAQAKAWIDRAQPRYWAGVVPNELRPAAAVLVAGRPRGAELFSGIERTLRFFLPYLGFVLGPVVGLRGVETPADLGASAWRQLQASLSGWP